MVQRSIHYVIAGWLLLSFHGIADETASIVRQGYFREITDSPASDYKIYSMRMSADGSTIAFMTGPSDAFTPDTLRVMASDGSDERIIATADPEDTQSYPIDVYDISDDGSTVIYDRRIDNNGFEWLNEIRAFDTATNTDRLLVAELAHLSANVSTSRSVSSEMGDGIHLLVLSGDGQTAYMGNSFGPVGSGNDNTEPDGNTIYRIDVASGIAAKVVSDRDLPALDSINPNAQQVFVSDSTLATNFDGSILIVPAGGGGVRPSPRSMLRFDAAKGASGVLFNMQADSSFSPDLTGPDLSSDGERLVLALYDDDALPDGVLLMNADGSGETTVLDEDTADRGRPSYPLLSGDGTVVIDRSDVGGAVEPSLRWLPTDGADVVLVSSDITIRPWSNFRIHSISSNGMRIALMGGVRHVNRPDNQEIIVFDWLTGKGVPDDIPAVDSVVASESFSLPRQPAVVTPETTDTFTYTSSGNNLGLMQAYAYDSNGDLIVIGLGSGTPDIADNGESGDEVAGDGIYTDTGIWANADDTLGTYTGRAAITSGNGTASFVDYQLSISRTYSTLGRLHRKCHRRERAPHGNIHRHFHGRRKLYRLGFHQPRRF